MSDAAAAYRDIDFRKHPERYVVGRGEQGVLIAQPYKSEILPHWKFATPQAAKVSAKKIFDMFTQYSREDDFVGMDMARKYLQMGFTRSRRYANHPSGKKYDESGKVRQQDPGWQDSPKAESARIFYDYYQRAKENPHYKKLLAEHKKIHEA